MRQAADADAFAEHDVGRFSAAAVADGLDRCGLATFHCADEDTFLGEARRLGCIALHRDSDQHGVTRIRLLADRDPERDIGLSTGELYLHTDCPATPRPPGTILLWCAQASGQGGEALLASARCFANKLRADAPHLLAAVSADDAALFRTGSHVRLSPILRMDGDCVVEARLRFDPYVHFSHAVASALPALRAALDAVAISFPLVAGAGYAIRNDIWLHGRRAYKGEREVLRIMLE